MRICACLAEALLRMRTDGETQYIVLLNIDGEREQANWDMAAILELQSVPFSFRKKTGGAAYCKKSIESMCVKLR